MKKCPTGTTSPTLTDFDRAIDGDNDQRSRWLLEHEQFVRIAWELVQPSAAPALDVGSMLQLMIGCKHPSPCPYCINTAKAINAEVARLRALQETEK